LPFYLLIPYVYLPGIWFILHNPDIIAGTAEVENVTSNGKFRKERQANVKR
jgi:hypothetical protein